MHEGFSVIIPTLQRSPDLARVVALCAGHPMVGEVLVVNNASEPLDFGDAKVRVLQQERNIFVNPAWNLGAREARMPWLAIINDDVLFADEALDEAARILRRGWFAMVGPDPSCFAGQGEFARAVSHRPATSLRLTFGTFMCLRASDYVPIPDDLLIWGGDDWLFWQQRRPNAILVHTRFSTDGSTTAGSPEFQRLRQLEHETLVRHWPSFYGKRWWHRPAAAVEKLRWARTAARQKLADRRSGSAGVEGAAPGAP